MTHDGYNKAVSTAYKALDPSKQDEFVNYLLSAKPTQVVGMTRSNDDCTVARWLMHNGVSKKFISVGTKKVTINQDLKYTTIPLPDVFSKVSSKTWDIRGVRVTGKRVREILNS